MTTAIEVYDPLPVCEECGKSYTGLNKCDFAQFFDCVVDDPICDACIEKGG